MNDKITQAVGRAYYPDLAGGSRLMSAPMAAGHRFPSIPDTELQWLNAALASKQSIVWLRTGEHGQYQSSLLEAQIVRDVVMQMLAGGLAATDIAVLTPFRQQVRQIQAHCSEMPSELRIDTVERLQGQEAEAVIVSMACSNPDWLSEAGPFFFSDARWNVAASRGRTKLIFVGSQALCEVKPADIRSLEAMTRFMTLLENATHVAVRN